MLSVSELERVDKVNYVCILWKGRGVKTGGEKRGLFITTLGVKVMPLNMYCRHHPPSFVVFHTTGSATAEHFCTINLLLLVAYNISFTT